MLLLIVLPFTFIRSFYAPWLEAQLRILDTFPRVGTVSGRPVRQQFAYGLSYLDLSTGHFAVAEGGLEEVAGELYRMNAQELLYPEAAELPPELDRFRDRERLPFTALPKGYFHLDEGVASLQRHFKVHSLEAFGCTHLPLALRAASAALAYAKDSKKSELSHLVQLTATRFDRYMTLDEATVRNLELIKPIHGEDESGTLFHQIGRAHV